MRSSKGRPTGDKVDEFSETEHIGDSKRQIIGSMQVPFSFVSGARFKLRESTKQATSVWWRGASALKGPRGHALCDHTRFENVNASSEWNSAKGPQLLRSLAGQTLHVIRYVGHREQTCANRL
jgi:hypothetical protein